MKYLLSVSAALIVAAGCTSSPQAAGPEDHSWKSDYSKWGKDPVTGGMILKRTASAHREYQGSMYYFRDQTELAAFDADPSLYLTPSPTVSSGEPHHVTNVHSR